MPGPAAVPVWSGGPVAVLPARRQAAGLRCQSWGKASGAVLEDAGGDGDADGDQDKAAEEFTPLTGLFADPAAQLQPDQGQGDADGTDDDRGDGEADVERAQSEADREIVDAQRRPGDQQPPGPLPGRCRRGLVLVVWAADGLHYGVQAGADQQRGADPVRVVAEGAGQAAA